MSEEKKIVGTLMCSGFTELDVLLLRAIVDKAFADFNDICSGLCDFGLLSFNVDFCLVEDKENKNE